MIHCRKFSNIYSLRKKIVEQHLYELFLLSMLTIIPPNLTFLSEDRDNYFGFILFNYLSGMIFFSYLIDFSYFPLKFLFPKVAGHSLNRSKMGVLKEGVDGLSHFN